MKISELRKTLETYAIRLGLGSWEIKLRWMTKRDLKDPQLSGIDECDGMSWWNAEHQAGTIIISRDSTDPIHTIIHELIHIRFEGHLAKPSTYDPLYELAINRTADCILALEAGVGIIELEEKAR